MGFLDSRSATVTKQEADLLSKEITSIETVLCSSTHVSLTITLFTLLFKMLLAALPSSTS